MARAKRTDRADARRRYRQTAVDEPLETEVIEDEAAPRAARPAPERPSVTSAFRNAYHQPHVREDIAALPQLLRTRSFLISAGLIVLATLAIAVLPGSAISTLLFQTMVVPPAPAPVFLVGFFARRASYLLGLIVAIIGFLGYAITIFVIAPGLADTPIDPAKQQEFVISALSVGPLSGMLFAAAAAWYRRFLTLSNAGAAQRAKERQQARDRDARNRARSRKPARG